MRFRLVTILSVASCLLVVASALAQDPISGSWSGDWGPNQYDRNNVTLELKYDGKALTGNITGGTNVSGPIAIQKATFDAKTGAVHMETDAKTPRGVVHYVIDGKVEKGTMSGSWNHDNRKGDFKLTKK